MQSPAPEAHPAGQTEASGQPDDDIAPIKSRIALLILQHPQEQDRALGTAALTIRHFQNATLKIGLSWPSLSKILGCPVEPSRWAILYLGSVKAADLASDQEIVVVDRKGLAEEGQRGILKSLEGVILLDGSWSQAKALWWRNGWMLKCRRIVLNPARRSLYGKLRREPRSDALSTLEAAAIAISRLDGRPEIEATLLASFSRMLGRIGPIKPPRRSGRAKPRPRRSVKGAA